MSVPFGNIDGYTLVDQLGKPGGFGVAFDARKDGKRFVVKVIHAELVEEVDRERFEREVKAMKRLGTHPNVVPYLDSGEVESDGRSFHYIVMPFLPGRTLRQLLDQDGGRIPPGRVRQIARQIAAGLVSIHAGEIVHRDLKPENIFVCDDGTIVLLDFGIARFLDYTSLTEHGQFVGTLKYAAPEQLRNEVEPATDLWALGVVMYEMLAGRRPFSGQMLELMHAVLHDDPEPVSSFAPDVPADLEQLVMRLLEKEPFDRPRSAGEVVQAMQPRAASTTHAEAREPYARDVAPMLFVRGGKEAAPVVNAIVHGLNPSAVVMPITEAHAVGDVRRAAKQYGIPYAVDPFVFRTAYSNFSRVKSLRQRDFAPEDGLTPYQPDDLRALEDARRVACGALDEQDACGADLLFAPSFAIRDLDDRWLVRNAKLLQLSLAHAEALGKPLFATLELPLEPLTNPEAQIRLVNRVARGRPAGYLVNFDQLDASCSADRQFWALRLLLLLQDAGAPAVLGRAGTLRYYFCAFGVGGIEDGLGRLAGFRLSDYTGERRPFGGQPRRFEVPSLLSSFTPEQAGRLLASGVIPEARCQCRSCAASSSVETRLAGAALHNVEMLKQEAVALAGVSAVERVARLRARIQAARLLERELRRQEVLPLPFPHLGEMEAAIAMALPLLDGQRIARRVA